MSVKMSEKLRKVEVLKYVKLAGAVITIYPLTGFVRSCESYQASRLFCHVTRKYSGGIVGLREKEKGLK